MEIEQFDWIMKNQDQHWWFCGRNELIKLWLKKYGNAKSENQILDIGTGYGATFAAVTAYGTLDALEPYQGCHSILKERGFKNIYEIENFPNNYPNKKYDLVCLFDVLEHIEDDHRALGTIKQKLLLSKGKLIITVPAYQWLWTSHDTINKHFRRYTKSQLVERLKSAGFNNIHCSYFMTLLFPFALIQRIKMKIFPSNHGEEFNQSALNTIFKKIFFFEKYLLKLFNLPFGLSIIIIADND